MNEIEKINKQALKLFSKKDIDTIKQFEELKAQVELINRKNSDKLKQLFRENGIKKFEGSGLRIIYKEPYDRTSVDTELLKQDGLYEKYSKTTKVADSVSVKVVYEDWVYWRNT